MPFYSVPPPNPLWTIHLLCVVSCFTCCKKYIAEQKTSLIVITDIPEDFHSEKWDGKQFRGRRGLSKGKRHIWGAFGKNVHKALNATWPSLSLARWSANVCQCCQVKNSGFADHAGPVETHPTLLLSCESSPRHPTRAGVPMTAYLQTSVASWIWSVGLKTWAFELRTHCEMHCTGYLKHVHRLLPQAITLPNTHGERVADFSLAKIAGVTKYDPQVTDEEPGSDFSGLPEVSQWTGRQSSVCDHNTGPRSTLPGNLIKVNTWTWATTLSPETYGWCDLHVNMEAAFSLGVRSLNLDLMLACSSGSPAKPAIKRQTLPLEVKLNDLI